MKRLSAFMLAFITMWSAAAMPPLSFPTKPPKKLKQLLKLNISDLYKEQVYRSLEPPPPPPPLGLTGVMP